MCQPVIDCSGERVSPEVQRAYEVLRQSLPRQQAYLVRQLPNELLTTGYKAFCVAPITKYTIPHTVSWTWRQSNGKVQLPLGKSELVTIAKLSPRKTSAATVKQPSYKVWTFEISVYNRPALWFIWCEKGEPIPITLRLGGQYPGQQVTFHSVPSFLTLPSVTFNTTTTTTTRTRTSSGGMTAASAAVGMTTTMTTTSSNSNSSRSGNSSNRTNSATTTTTTTNGTAAASTATTMATATTTTAANSFSCQQAVPSSYTPQAPQKRHPFVVSAPMDVDFDIPMAKLEPLPFSCEFYSSMEYSFTPQVLQPNDLGFLADFM